MNFLLHLHPMVSFTLLSLSCAALAVLCLIIIRKMVPEQHLKENHEVAGIIFNAFGLIYAVLIAFVVFATWSSYDTTKKNIEMEAAKLEALFYDAGVFDSPIKDNIRVALADYTKIIVEEDWPIMASGGQSTQSRIEAHNRVWKAYKEIEPKKIKNKSMYEESLRQLNAMLELRRLRRLSSRSYTPTVIWLVMIVGGIMAVVYTFFLGAKHIIAQCFMTGVYTIMNSMVLFLIYVLDHPFMGYSAISNEPFSRIFTIFSDILRQ